MLPERRRRPSRACRSASRAGSRRGSRPGQQGGRESREQPQAPSGTEREQLPKHGGPHPFPRNAEHCPAAGACTERSMQSGACTARSMQSGAWSVVALAQLCEPGRRSIQKAGKTLSGPLGRAACNKRYAAPRGKKAAAPRKPAEQAIQSQPLACVRLSCAA